jgi:hypothetical protein
MTASAGASGGRWSAARPMRLTSRILTSRSEHESFSEMFRLLGGSSVALDYLHGARVRGFFRGDELLAGYVLNARAPFRYSSWVPENARAALHKGGLVEPRCAELTCMWMTKGLRQLERNRIYVQTMADAFSCGKRLIFAGSRVEKVARIQKTTLPKTVYRGAAIFGGTCEIYCANRYVMIAHFVSAAIAKYARDLARMICRYEGRPVTGRMQVPVTTVRPSSSAAPDFTSAKLNQI